MLRAASHEHPDWTTYSQVRVFITDLPIDVTTLAIYQNFKQYGNISEIRLLEKQSLGRGSRAEVEFNPPPAKPFWASRIPLRFDGRVYLVSVRLSHKQSRKIKITSLLRKGVEYPEQIQLRAQSIQFGVLIEPLRMLTFQSRQSYEDKPQIILNLRNKCLDILFPSLMQSDKSSATRIFRFRAPLDEDFKIWRQDGSGFILHLSNIPSYSKQLKEAMDGTHTHAAKRWSLEDTWARQTDIVDHKSDIDRIRRSAVSLRKDFNNINIARWTTFKLNLGNFSYELCQEEKSFYSALKDFNIEVLDGTNFAVTEGSPSVQDAIWTMLDLYLGAFQSSFLKVSPRDVALTFRVQYQLAVCISHGWLSEFNLSNKFFEKLSETAPGKAEQMLLHLSSLREREWDPLRLFNDLRYQKPVKARQLPADHVEIRSATVTATAVLFHSPSVEMTNRVIRKHKQYAERFLRVRFEDDAYRGQKKLYPSTNNKNILIFRRVKQVLQQGIRLGNLHYEFLAWGNSQLREHGAYFFAKIGPISAASIREDMGVFDKEKVVAKRAARMGQCFSTTRPVRIALPLVTDMNTIPDICNGSRNFTDGVGMMSLEVAQKIKSELKISGEAPSVFQFRLGGCKGVLSVWPELKGIDIKVRASQFKFSSTSSELEVIRWSEFWQPFLNRQLIICLSSLGVPDHVFLTMQEEVLQTLKDAMHDDRLALKALRDTVDPNRATLSLCGLIESGFRSSREPFVICILRLWRAWITKNLKEKAKIPVRQGAFVLGCADETGTLRGHFEALRVDDHLTIDRKAQLIPEIFIQITNPQTGAREIITKTCVLARNPSLHRGDIRVVQAVDIPALRHLCDVVVMPVNGDRDLPSMCSGGDLDGDDYIVIWDPKLIPQVWNEKPFHYNAPTAKTVVGEIQIDDIIEFFYDYLQNDCLGRIAHAHLGAADFFDEGIQSSDCLELVQLHSLAVDYAKTGVPATMVSRLDRTTWPHFMEKKASTYKSSKILGQLYDAVGREAFEPVYGAPGKNLINGIGPRDYALREAVKSIKQDYDTALQRIMVQHDIKTEFEVFSTFVLHHSKASSDYKFHEEIGNLSNSLKEQYRQNLYELAEGHNHEQLAPVALAAYQFTQEQVQIALEEIEEDLRMPGPEGMPFISFPWLLQDTLCWMARNQTNGTTSIQKTSLDVDIEHQEESMENPTATENDNVHDTISKETEQIVDEFDVQFPADEPLSAYMADPFVCKK